MTKTTDISNSTKGDIKYLGRIFSYMMPYRRSMMGVLVALILASSAVLSLGRGLKHLVDEGFTKNDPALLIHSLIFMLVIIIVLAGATYARFFLITKVGEQVIADIRRDVYRNLLSLSPSFFEVTKPGELVSRLTTDTTLLQTVIGSSLSIALRNILLLAGGIAMLFFTSAKLAAYIAFMVPLVVLPILFLGRKVRSLSRNAQGKVASLASHIEETIAGVKTVQAYGKEKQEQKDFSYRVQESFEAAMLRVRMRAMLTAIVILLAFGAVGVVLFIGGMEVFSGNMSGGALSSFLFYSLVVAGAFGAISEVVGDLHRAGGAAERIIELLNLKSEIKEQSSTLQLPDNDGRRELSFEKVTFFYPASPKTPALNDISFNVNQGKTVALVGASGAGKSTILQLLLRFYDPAEGKITLNGVDIRKLSLAELRAQFAYVSQDPMIFSTSAYENIAYGKEGASEQEVIAAAKAAYAYDFIKRMPYGFDTFLGEKGVRISGGERQRIALARAILRNPGILLLDEATSALDSESEHLVKEALEKLSKNRTTIIIAHRLSTIQKADLIIVMNQGTIEAVGTHAELMARESTYKRLAEMQFAA